MKLTTSAAFLGILFAAGPITNSPLVVTATSSGRREYSYRNTQIKGEIWKGKAPNDKVREVCWAVRKGKKYDKVVLEKCDDNDESQRFHIENYVTSEGGRSDRPLWDDFYDEATVIDTCDYCDVGTWVVIRTKADPSMVVTAHSPATENSWLHLEKTNDRNIDLMTQVFVDIEGGELILGDGKCDYNEDCLHVTTQGLGPDIGDPIMLRTGRSMAHFKKHGDPIDYWDPFGS